MKLGIFTACMQSKSLVEAWNYAKELGATEIEVGTGGSPGTHHCDSIDLMSDEKKLQNFINLVKDNDIKISALSTHNNPVHPNKEIAKKANDEFEATVLLAEKLGVKTVITFSGCPGDCEESKYPNWAVATWPDDYQAVRDWQWNEKLIPYWKKAGYFSKNHGVKVALEIHPGFCVYNVPTMLKLNEAVGDSVGANVDPSHLFWQGMDPVAAIKALKGIIYHFHAKDTRIDPYNTAVNGVLDTTSFADVAERPWVFSSLGYGHNEEVWRKIFVALRLAGYDGSVSIEHEDATMSADEGLSKTVEFLKAAMMFEKNDSDVFWA